MIVWCSADQTFTKLAIAHKLKSESYQFVSKWRICSLALNSDSSKVASKIVWRWTKHQNTCTASNNLHRAYRSHWLWLSRTKKKVSTRLQYSTYSFKPVWNGNFLNIKYGFAFKTFSLKWNFRTSNCFYFCCIWGADGM